MGEGGRHENLTYMTEVLYLAICIYGVFERESYLLTWAFLFLAVVSHLPHSLTLEYFTRRCPAFLPREPEQLHRDRRHLYRSHVWQGFLYVLLIPVDFLLNDYLGT